MCSNRNLFRSSAFQKNDSGRSPSSPGGSPPPGRWPIIPPDRIPAGTSSSLGSLRASKDIPSPQRWVLQTTSPSCLTSCHSLSRPCHDQLLLRRARERHQVVTAVLHLDVKPGQSQQGVKLLRKVYPHRQFGDDFLGTIFQSPEPPGVVDLCRRVINAAFGHDN